MKLIVQPDAGVAPIVTAIKQAKKSIDILIFRLDRGEIAHALEAAVARGVRVRALTAHTNRGGTKSLRKLEMQLLDGRRHRVAHRRRSGPLPRQDDDRRRQDRCTSTASTSPASTSPRAAASASSPRTTSSSRSDQAVRWPTSTASPTRPATSASSSARRTRASGSARFIKGARKQLLIYDPQVSDDAMLRLIARADQGRRRRADHRQGRGEVERSDGEKYPGRRLHVRAIIRDGERAFVGSQSLRRLELDKRREVGVIVTDEAVVKQMQDVFEKDWAQTTSGKKEAKKTRRRRRPRRRSRSCARDGVVSVANGA